MIEDERAPNFDREITNENSSLSSPKCIDNSHFPTQKATGIICVCVKSEEQQKKKIHMPAYVFMQVSL